MKTLIYIIIGIFIGWITVPVLKAEFLDDSSYKGLLRQMIQMIAQIEKTSHETAENTRAIKEKLGAK